MLKVAGFSCLSGWMFLLHLTVLAGRNLFLWFPDWLYLFLGSLHLLCLLLGLSFHLSSSFLLPGVYPQGQLCNFIPFRFHFSRVNRRGGHLFYFILFFLYKIEYPINSRNKFSAPLTVGLPLSSAHMTWLVPRAPGECSVVHDGDEAAGHLCFFHGCIWLVSQSRSDSHLFKHPTTQIPIFHPKMHEIILCYRA